MQLKQFLIASAVYVLVGAVLHLTIDALSSVAPPGGIWVSILGDVDYTLHPNMLWLSAILSAVLMTWPVLFRPSIKVAILASILLFLPALYCSENCSSSGYGIRDSDMAIIYIPIFMLGIFIAYGIRRWLEGTRSEISGLLAGLAPFIPLTILGLITLVFN